MVMEKIYKNVKITFDNFHWNASILTKTFCMEIMYFVLFPNEIEIV